MGSFSVRRHLATRQGKNVGKRQQVQTKDSVRAVERAIDVLFAFSVHKTVLDLPALQVATGLSRPTLYRLLHTLEEKGVIHGFGDPLRFQVGYRLGALTAVWEKTFPIVAIAHPRLEHLAKRTQETVALMLATSASERVCVLEFKSTHAIAFSRGVGYLVPMHRGASGKVMLAHWAPARVEHALRGLDVSHREQVSRQLREIRRSEVCVTYGEVESGAVSIAAAVLDPSGEAVASICVFSPEMRMPTNAVDATKKLVKATAASISSDLAKGR